ncbi:MAG TPA: beta-1,3-glucanase family protein [Polyangiaceae bacterium]
MTHPFRLRRLSAGCAIGAALSATLACSASSGGGSTAPPGATAGDSGTSATPPGNGDAGGSTPPAGGDAGTPSSPDSGSSGPTPFDASTPPDDGAAPPGFWDTSNIPPAKNVMTFKFLNRTNGKLADSEVFWSFKNGSISETHSIAEQPTYDMPANNSGRMYFYLCGAATSCTGDPTQSKYYDFIEHTIGATQYNGNTTRVDAFGVKIAMRLHCADGYDLAVGEDYETFAEDRAATFQKFLDEVPAEFQPLAQAPNAPYRIVEPGAGQFKTGGTEATYYDDFVNLMWTNNGLTIAKPGPNGGGLGSYPDVSAAIFRHVGDKAGSFSPDGKLLDKTLWASAPTFYTAAPANYYAKFWHTHGLNGKAYGFPYDDVGGYSSYVSHANPQYMLVAIGW